MSRSIESVQAQVPAVEPTEERETQVYTASRDMLVANVVYTPAGDIQGDWNRPRYMQLRVGRPSEPEGRFVADASAQTSNFHLPANVPQDIVLTWTNQLYVRERETLYWHSHIVRSHHNDGIPDPGGIVEVVLEPTNVDEAGPAQLVPRYWQGKRIGIDYRLSEIPRGGGTVYHTDYVGRFVQATDTGIALEVETPQTLGIDRETYEFPYGQIMSIRLL